MSTVRLSQREAQYIFGQMKFDVKAKKWKGVSKAQKAYAEHFKKKISRPTIYKLIELYPEGVVKRAKKVEPRFVAEFKETEAWKGLYDHKFAKRILPILMMAWKLLDKKEPLDWTVEDVRSLRKPKIKGKDNPLYIPVTKDISPQHAVNLRRAFKGLSLFHLEKPLEGVPKRPIGVRRQWFLEGHEIIRMILGMTRLDVLLFMILDLQCGARPSSMVAMKVSDINYAKNYVQYYESKTKEYVPRFFIPETMSLLKRYIVDHKLKPNQKLFQRKQRFYTTQLQVVARRQNIEKLQIEGAGAYILRHTFATQASEHDVSMEVVMKQGNWKDAKTVMDHYMFIKTSKMMRELLGVEIEKPKNFGDWIRQFVPHWEKRYLHIKEKFGTKLT